MAEESNILKEIKTMLGLNSETRELDSEEIKGTIRLLKYRDEIWNEIRKKYIRKILNCEGKYELCECEKNTMM